MQLSPSGTITFLFTDIEGSTARWEAYGSDMQAAVVKHDRAMREVFEQHGGYVFKTVGDAFCVAFHTAPEALAAAVEAQRSLTAMDHSAIDGITVRMALHSGHADERDGDYFGPTVNRVARLMSIGHGGQILVSAAARALFQTALPAGISLVALGSHRLKDLAHPEDVWQVAAPDLAVKFPALTSLDSLPNNLPNQLTSFHGREQELEELRALLKANRLVTLAGCGGIGKTRLALQMGADLLEQFPDGVWLADLESLRWPELASSAISKALNVGQSQDRAADESVIVALQRRHMLIILDNCEHVMADVAKLADDILRHCAKVHILATSRQPLNLSGEQVVRMEPLPLPDPRLELQPGDVTSYPALTLFMDRARAVNKNFALADADDAFMVAQICHHLDGLPLAIELAAARMKVLNLNSLSQRLSDRFGLLSGGSRTAQPRQRTLTGLIDWSYELLTPQEQAVFCRLSVFAGGFGLDAAENVGADDSMDGMDVLDVLSSLTDKSLVVANTARRNERYHMLESLRAYAMEKLNLTSEVRERVQRQHADYFQKTAELAGESFGTKPDASWLLDVEPEIDNFRVALNWAFGAGENALLGSIIAGSLEHLWSEGGLEAEGRKWISEAQSRLDETAHPRVAARLWRALAGLTSGKRSYEAAQRACALSEAAGEERGLAYAMYVLATSLQDAGKLDEAQALNERVYQWFNQYGDKRNVAACLRQQANVLEKQGDMAGARKLYERALAVFKALDAQSDSAIVFANLARLAFREGNALEALSDVDRAIEFASNARNATHLAAYHIDSAVYRIALGNFDVARKEALDGLHWAREAKNDVEVVAAIEHLALVTALKKQAQQAARLFGYADAKYKQLEEARTEANAWSMDKLMIALRDELGEPEIRAFSAEGAAWSDEQAVREALKV